MAATTTATTGKRTADTASLPTTAAGAEKKDHVFDTMTIQPLGAGSEVGRSCILLKFKGKTIMLDCGIHPAYEGLGGLPYFDEIDDPSEIDLLLVSHFHLDHAAALPYFTQKTDFKGRVFMTHPTKPIYRAIISDYVKVSNVAADDRLYDKRDLIASLDKIETIDYHQVLEHNGIKFWCYNAGHVLGAAMFMIEIAGVRVLYTGDFSREEDRHLMSAELPDVQVDVLIVESTYGVQVHEPRQAREARFLGIIHDVVVRGGRCLLPVFALGRSQELLLVLEEYWKEHAELQHVPIYYASVLARKCMPVYQTYINMMNEKIRKQFSISNPFNFQYVKNLRGMSDFIDHGPSVVMASPGMLQSGLSRELFERWCSDRRNAVILPGYCVEGTLAKHIMNEPATITTSSGLVVPRHIAVYYISFSAHSDFAQTSAYIDMLQPPNIVLVHGEANEMGRLKNALVQKYQNKSIRVMTPRNTEQLALQFRAEKVAKVIGALAAEPPHDGKPLAGILVRKDFAHTIVAPADLATFNMAPTATISQRLVLCYAQEPALTRDLLATMFDGVMLVKAEDAAKAATGATPAVVAAAAATTVLIHATHRLVFLPNTSPPQVALEWSPSTVATDMMADTIVALLMQAQSNPAIIKTRSAHAADSARATASVLTRVLESHFGAVTVDASASSIDVDVDGVRALVVVPTPGAVGAIPLVQCESAAIKARIDAIVTRVVRATSLL